MFPQMFLGSADGIRRKTRVNLARGRLFHGTKNQQSRPQTTYLTSGLARVACGKVCYDTISPFSCHISCATYGISTIRSAEMLRSIVSARELRQA